MLLKQVKDPVALDLMRALKARARPARPAQSRQGSLIGRSALEFRRFARQEADMRARGAKRRSTAVGCARRRRRADGSCRAARRGAGAAVPACAPRDFDSAPLHGLQLRRAPRRHPPLLGRRRSASPTAVSPRSPQALAAHGRTLRFAMNAGMFGDDLAPVGLYVEDGKRLRARRHPRRPEQFPSLAQRRVLDRRRRRRRRGDLALSRRRARRRASPPSPVRCW